jgi:hypothetical protein
VGIVKPNGQRMGVLRVAYAILIGPPAWLLRQGGPNRRPCRSPSKSMGASGSSSTWAPRPTLLAASQGNHREPGSANTARNASAGDQPLRRPSWLSRGRVTRTAVRRWTNYYHNCQCASDYNLSSKVQG